MLICSSKDTTSGPATPSCYSSVEPVVVSIIVQDPLGFCKDQAGELTRDKLQTNTCILYLLEVALVFVTPFLGM